MKLALVRFLFIGALALAGACTPSRPDPSPPLRLGYTPAEDTLTDREGAQQRLASYLSKQLGAPVELVRTGSYGPAVEALREGSIDLIPLGPFAYMIAAEAGAAEAIAVRGSAQGEPLTYQSVMVANAQAGISTLAEAVAKAKSLRLCLTDRASNSGFLVPNAVWQCVGLDAERDFASTELTLSHVVSLFSVVHGRADLCGMNASVLERLVARGKVSPERFRVLWRSEAMPVGPFVVRSGLPQELKRRIQEALVALPHADPGAAKEIMAQYPEPGTVFLPCTDRHYDSLRRLLRGEGHSAQP